MNHDLKAAPARVQMQVVVRDKDGNVKYAGPLDMHVTHMEPMADSPGLDPQENPDGSNAPDRG